MDALARALITEKSEPEPIARYISTVLIHQLEYYVLCTVWRRGRDSNPCEPEGPLACLSHSVLGPLTAC